MVMDLVMSRQGSGHTVVGGDVTRMITGNSECERESGGVSLLDLGAPHGWNIAGLKYLKIHFSKMAAAQFCC